MADIAGLSDAGANVVLDHFFGDAVWDTTAITWYVALFTTTPDADGTGGVEVSGGSYARVATAAADWSAAASRSKTNTAILTFPTATADWGAVISAGFFTASSGGTLYQGAVIDASRTVLNGDILKFLAGSITTGV